MEAVCVQGMHVKPMSSELPALKLSYLAKVGVECKQEPVFTNWADSASSTSDQDTPMEQCSVEDTSSSPPDTSAIDGISLSEREGLRWHGTQLATFCPLQRVFRCGLCSVTAFVDREMAEHWLGAHAAFKAFQCPRCPYMSSWQRCVRMHLIRHHNDRLAEVVEFDNANAVRSIQEQLTRLKRMCEQRSGVLTSVAGSPIASEMARKGFDGESCATVGSEDCQSKRHHCPYCPYSTHRRDLFNRHENIHKSDKPFHCYICKKMFNRADHVKKHFLRIHREVAYDVKRIRRIPPKTLTAQVYYARAPTLPASESALDTARTSRVDPSMDERTNLPASDEMLPNDNDNDNCDRHSVTSSTDADSGTVSPQFDLPVEQISSAEGITKVHEIENESVAREKVDTPEDFNTIASEKNLSNSHTSDHFHFSDESMNINQPHVRTQLQRKDERPRRKQECYSCPQCPWKGFDSWCLKRHVNTHIKPFTCTLCPYKAARSERLSFHVTKVHSKRICVKCFWICEDVDSLSEHMAQNHGNNQNRQEYTCLTCACVFRTPEQLENHMVSAHSRKVLNCIQCSFHTTDADVLQDHVRYSHDAIQDHPPNSLADSSTGTSGMTPVILKVPSVSPAAQPTGQCKKQAAASAMDFSSQSSRTVTAPLAKTSTTLLTTKQTSPPHSSCAHRSSDQLRCRAGDCHFQTSCSSQLDRHVQQQHEDRLPRCPHCALPLPTPLELCMHWPLHHATLCWHCVLLVQRHCIFIEQLGQQEVGDGLSPDEQTLDYRSNKLAPSVEEQTLDYCSDKLSPTVEEQTLDFCSDSSDSGASLVYERDPAAMIVDQRDCDEKENNTKRSRKQLRPKRCLNSEKENTLI